MVFKQTVLREEKIKFGIIITCVSFPLIFLIVWVLAKEIENMHFVLLLLIICLPIFLLILFLVFKNLEWYCVYDERIDVKCVFGKKNSVYFDNVIFVEELQINLSSRGMEKTFYIFNDGRKNNNNILDVNSCYNSKKYNLRIYKTAELENYILNIRNLPIIRK